MADKVEINDPVDWAIIQSFYRAEKHILMLKKIVSIVRESSDKKDKAIEARIRKLVEKSYLVKLGESKEDNHDTESSEVKRRPGLYGLNKGLEFEYTGVPLTLIEVPAEIRRSHTNELKGAIKDWIKYFPEPTFNYPLSQKNQLDPASNLDESANPLKLDPYTADIAACEQHLLFSDLGNHLHDIECDTCAKWERYKKELDELNKMQKALLDSIAAEVERWLCNNIAFYMYEIPRSGKLGYDIGSAICPLLLKYVSGDKSEIEFILSACAINLIIKRSSLDPKLLLDFIKAPQRDKLIGREELASFSMVIESILQKKRIMGSAEKIVAKIRELGLERSIMMSELEKALLYTSYPGDCQYMR